MASETLKIAKLQAKRDVAVAVIDAVKTNPMLGLVTGFVLAEGAQHLGWLSPEAKRLLFGAGVTGSVAKAFAGSTINPLQLAALPVKGAVEGVKKFRSAMQPKVIGSIPMTPLEPRKQIPAHIQAEIIADNIQDEDERRGFWHGLAHKITFGKVK